MTRQIRNKVGGMLGVVLAALLLAVVPALAQQGGAELYDQIPEPLTIAQCGQCHTKHFMDLRNHGGNHRFDCRDCHQVFHAYNPLRNNYAQIMPKCSMCHHQPHGPKQVECLNCHTNPHAPKLPPDTAKVRDVCADCHGGPAQELKQKPSKHTQVACASCHHQQHGYIPECSECHKPHFQGQPFNGCVACHPVHKPLEITFRADDEAQTCRDCHTGVFNQWKNTPSKHGEVNCAMCHTSHGMIPDCLSCHATPHPEAQLRLFPRCLDCHLDVHDLPVKR